MMNDENLADRLAIAEVMYRYALAIDTKDWPALEMVFADRIRADFREFGVREEYQGSSAGWIANIRAGIAGMDATQHMMGNHLYDISGEQATGTTYLRAIHICKNDWGGDSYTIGGHYEVALARGDGGWRINSYKLRVTWSHGNRHVLRAAMRRARS